MVSIVFETHATSLDNEANLSSGHNDIELSPLGLEQADELRKRYANDKFDAIFCSNLQRAYRTAEIAFGDKFPIIQDARLRECDYGDLTQHSKEEVEPLRATYISQPFPDGESYEQTSIRMKNFLKDLLRNYNDKKVMIIGHRATQYGLEYWINGVSLNDSIAENWKWQPGWEYKLSKIQ